MGTETLTYEDNLIPDDGSTGIEIEDTSGEERITQPFNPSLIRVETRLMTIDLLVARIREKELDLGTGFQRKAGIWKEDAQSRLIESILIRIPLPAFYLDATDDDKWLVVDGVQRLTTLRRFIIDEEKLRLIGLEFLDQLEGKNFDELPRNFQRRILETQVTVYLIEQGTPDEAKFNIFKRINTGVLPLSAQEIRHALNQGKAAELLERLANSEEFKKATDYGIRDERMADRECVLRFLAFTITPYTEYTNIKPNGFDNFLNDSMAKINKMEMSDLENLERRFLRAMQAALDIFGKDAFRKLYKVDGRRNPINKALFESWSVNLNLLDDNQIKSLIKKKHILNNKFIKLMNKSTFNDAISQATGNSSKVKLRFSEIETLIKEVLS
ncbi:DUF262 domain-containing protein [bacterium]|nr:DUF262 domain-containing protein [bacterium]